MTRAATADVALIGALVAVTAGLLTLPTWPRHAWLLVVGGALLLLAILAIVRERVAISPISARRRTYRGRVSAGHSVGEGGVGGGDITTR